MHQHAQIARFGLLWLAPIKEVARRPSRSIRRMSSTAHFQMEQELAALAATWPGSRLDDCGAFGNRSGVVRKVLLELVDQGFRLCLLKQTGYFGIIVEVYALVGA
jgi:hypothetical protein